MKIENLMLTLLSVSLFQACKFQQPEVNTAQTEELYNGIEFPMPLVQEPVIPDRSVIITDFGARSGGQFLCTGAITAAINALVEKGGGKVVIPRGTWLTGPVTLQSNIEIHTEPGALVVFSPDKSLYPLVETSFEGLETYRCISPINGRNLTNIAITGEGIFDGSGEAWRLVKKEKLTERQWKKLVESGGVVSEDNRIWYPSQQYIEGQKVADMNVPRSLKTKEEFERIKDFLRPVMVSLISCNKVLIDGPTFQNSPAWNIHPLMCEDFTMRNTTVRNPWFSQNGDGIDIESCKNSLIYNSSFDVGDDAICIKSGKDKDGRDRNMPTENLVVRNCVVYHGHGGITVGSEMSGGVKNVHVSNCTFIGTDVGIRFKSTRGRGGVVENIYLSDIDMMNIPTHAISFNLYYSGRSVSEDLEAADGKATVLLPVTEETPSFRNIFMERINCKGALQAIQLQGLPEMNLENIRLKDVMIQADYGLVCSDANGIQIENLNLVTTNMPAIDIINSKNVSVSGLDIPAGSKPAFRVLGPQSGNIVFRNTSVEDPEKMLETGKGVPDGAVKFE